MVRTLVFLFSLTAFHCLNNGKSFNEVEPNALPATVTWTEHALPTLKKHCNECHSSGPESKYGTVSGIDYSLYENAIPVATASNSSQRKNGFQNILGTAINSSYMPPGNKERLNPYERALLLRWQEQGFLK